MARRRASIIDRTTAKRALRPVTSAWRSVAGNDSVLEERVKRALRVGETARGPGFVEWQSTMAFAVRATADPEPKVGIYLRGACDLPTLLSVAPMFRAAPRGTVAMANAARQVGATRVDLLLQTLDGVPADATAEVRHRLALTPDYFEPTLFSPTFFAPGLRHLGAFPKTIVVLSVAPNVVRTLYRHREHGFLVDPGGMWMNQDLDVALRDEESVAWFRENFELVGRMPVEDFERQFRELVRLLRERARVEHILVFNVLTVEPFDRIHNYQLRRNPETLRRREFCLALVDLSRELDIHIVDVDRVLKHHGVDRQVDFAHFPTELGGPIATEVFDILRSLDIA